MIKDYNFSTGDYVVYPAHGVGKIEAVETHVVDEHELNVYVISFDDDRMKLRLPVGKAKSSGLRTLTNAKDMSGVLYTLRGKAKLRKGVMWARRAQEYEGKINSGDPVSLAEVIRDLHRTGEEAEQSYSERLLYQEAIARLTSEIAVIEKIDTQKAEEIVSNALKAA